MKSIFTLCLLILGFGLNSQTVVQDADLGSGTYNWTSDTEYILDGYVYLEEGGVLNIEAGTIIRAKTLPTTTDRTSALIITRGAQIYANGTADAPIIFTNEFDNLSTCEDFRAADNSTWGGIIILGNAPISEDLTTEAFPIDVIEGISSNEPRIVYGGTDPMDNSGSLKYVSLRHGGDEIEPDNEINGLTLGGVGAGTTIDYIEVFANKDDGIEFFGGTVNVTHAVIAFCGDDALDFDESWDGTIQFALTVHLDDVAAIGDNSVEYDGGEATDGEPKTVGKIYNATFVGAGVNSDHTDSRGLRIKKDGAAQFWNCVWTGFSDYAFRFEDSSIDRYNAGETAFVNNYVFGYQQLVQDDLVDLTGINEMDPLLGGTDQNGGFDPRPNGNSPVFGSTSFGDGDDVEQVDYAGAFGFDNWTEGWTALSDCGYFDDLISSVFGVNKNIDELSVFPNPVDNFLNIDFTLNKTSEITIQAYDMMGRLIETPIQNQTFSNGQHFEKVYLNQLVSGSYLIALKIDGKLTATNIVTKK